MKFEFNKPFLKFLPLFTIMLVFIALISSSYAYVLNMQAGKNDYIVKVGTLEVTFVDSDTNYLVLENAYPMTDNDGKNQENELIFRVKNTGNVDANYDIYIDTIGENDEILDFAPYIKFTVSKNDQEYSIIKILNQDNYIDKLQTIKPLDSTLYKVKAWLTEDTPSNYMNKTYKARIVINGNQGE